MSKDSKTIGGEFPEEIKTSLEIISKHGKQESHARFILVAGGPHGLKDV